MLGGGGKTLRSSKIGLLVQAAKAGIAGAQAGALGGTTIGSQRFVYGPVTPQPMIQPIGGLMYHSTSLVSFGSTISALPWYKPGSLALTLQEYLEEKPVEYELSEPSHYQWFPRPVQSDVIGVQRGDSYTKKIKITFTHLPRKLFQDVIFPELKRIGKKFNRPPRLGFPYTYPKKRKKLTVFM